MALYGLCRMLLYLKAQLGHEAYCPKYAQCILRKAFIGISHASDASCLQVRKPGKFIHQTLFIIIGHGIDRKIPALKILRKRRREADLLRMSSVLIFSVYPVCRHLIRAKLILGTVVLRGMLYQHGHGAMLYAGIHRPVKYLLYLHRCCRGGYVPILRGPSKQAVPYASPHSKGLMALLGKLIDYVTDILGQLYFYAAFTPHPSYLPI